MYKDVMEALEAAGFELVPREDVKLGDSVVGAQSDTSEAMFAGEVVGNYSGYTRVLDKPCRVSAYVGATHVWRKPAQHKPGTYASVTYKGEELVGVSVRGGAWVVVDTEGDPYPTWDSVDSVQVNEVLWEPHAPKATGKTAWPTETPTVKLLRENPAWCFKDSDGDYWWAEGEDVMIDYRSLSMCGRWDGSDEEANELLRVFGGEWELRKA